MKRDVTVREVMDHEFVGVSESDGALETAELLLEEDADTAIVLRGSEPVGVLTARGVLAHAVDEGDLTDVAVGEVMTESVPTIEPEMTIAEARDRMSAWSTSWLVVTGGGEPDGIVTEHDILATSALGSETTATEEDEHQDRIQRQLAGAGAAEAETEPAQPEGFDEQSICELCGSLARDLSAFNGQLLCADCRDI